jgi:hypothetical protein
VRAAALSIIRCSSHGCAEIVERQGFVEQLRTTSLGALDESRRLQKQSSG